MSEKPPSLLKDKQFRTLWATVELTFLGMFIHVVASSWIMTGLTSSATLVALIQSAQALPVVLFAMVAGALADTHDRRIIMLGALALSIAGSLALAILAHLDLLTPWLLLGLVFVIGLGMAIFTPPWQASLGDLVPRERITDAVSLHNIGANTMRTVGPFLGGMLLTVISASLTFALAAVSYLPALVALLRWKRPVQPPSRDRESVFGAFWTGLHYMTVSPQLQQLLMRSLIFSFGAISVMSLLPLIAKDQIGMGAGSYGMMLGGFGFGAILGGLGLGTLRARFADEHIIRWCFVLNIGAVLLLATASSLAGGMPSIVTSGTCWLICHALLNSNLQMAVPRWIAGRIVAMIQLSAFLGIAVGGGVWGAVAEFYSTNTALACSAVALLAAWLFALRFPLPILGVSFDPLDVIDSPVGLDQLSYEGPLQVIIDYQIQRQDLRPFHAIMQARRRHLTQLGAHHWQMMRDISDPMKWTETFQTPTVADYRRMMMRRTKETAQLREALIDMQHDAHVPVARLLLHSPNRQSLIDTMLGAQGLNP